MRILLDVDGVLANPGPAAARFLGNYYDPAAWDFGCANAPENLRAAWWEHFGSPGFCANLPPYPRAYEFVQDLSRLGVVHIVTSPFSSCTWHAERARWLYEHMAIGLEEITFTHRKDIIRGDVLIDDKLSNVREWQKANPEGLGILFAQPYNCDTVALRADGYDEVLHEVRRHART